MTLEALAPATVTVTATELVVITMSCIASVHAGFYTSTMQFHCLLQSVTINIETCFFASI